MKLFSNPVFRQMVVRAIRTDYLNNVTGFAWLIIQPLLLLAVYAFVFTYIFKARLPADHNIAFVPFLAVAFWPWTAFSESVLRASNSVSSNASLIGKVAFPVEILPLSTVTATFVMHMIGYLGVLVILAVTGTEIHWLGVLLAVPCLFLLYLFACGLALAMSGLQVFIRDVSQILPPLMTFWFFTTPILYSADILPDAFGQLMQFNPMAWFVESLRALILLGDWSYAHDYLLMLGWSFGVFVFSLWFFRRFSSHFEDFL